MKATYKLTLYSDTESAHEGCSNAALSSPDTATNELLIDMGRGLYKLLFQLLLLIECDHKISINVLQNLRGEQMENCSDAYTSVRGALLRSIDDTDMDSLDTSTSTEGEHTPTASPGPQPSAHEFETTLGELIDAEKWTTAVAYVRQYRKYSSTITLSPSANFALQTSSSAASCASSLITIGTSNDFGWTIDDVSIILNVFAQRLIKDRNGEQRNLKWNVVLHSIGYCMLFINIFHPFNRRRFCCLTQRVRHDRDAWNSQGQSLSCTSRTHQHGSCIEKFRWKSWHT